MSNLYEFLTEIATNPNGQEAFKQNPASVMAAAELSQKDQAILNSKDSSKITEAFADELPEPSFWILEPDPDPLPDPDPPPDSSPAQEED